MADKTNIKIIKSTIAISLAGVLVDKKPWREAHKIGMKEHFDNLGLSEKDFDGDYFDVVEKSIKKSWPDLSAEERIAKRRRIYFDRVLNLIDDNANEEVVEFFQGLKDRYSLVLVTTNDEDMTKKVLDLIGGSDLFDYVFSSKIEEKDDKRVVFERLIKKIGKPEFLIEESKRLEEFCRMNDIKYIEFNLEEDSLSELKGELDGN
jgi:FMN phosphatase YigB (HAD superfamily)